MNRMSPPAGVQARPTATPGRFTRSATSVSTRTWMPPRNSLITSRVTTSFSAWPSTTRRACLRQTVPMRLLQFADARLPRVVAHNVAHRILGKLDLLGRDSVLLDLPRNQVPVGDVHLLLFAVALQGDHLHPVQQRRRHRVQHVRRADEQHLATDRTARPDSCRGTCCSAPDPASPAAPRPDRRGSLFPACPPRPA